MLDDFINDQPIVHKVLTNSIKKGKPSHAYLFELNGYSKGRDLALAFAKFLLCPYNYSNNNKCKDCSQCHNIDTNNFLEIKIIETEGQWIKKEQLEELQREFMTKSLVGKYKVYIINGAEKLNVSSSNALLKFLEEPPESIIAILLTDNIYQLLNTLVSRCQVLSFKKNVHTSLNSIENIAKYLYNDQESYNNFINDYGIKYVDAIIDYIYALETKKEETIIYNNKSFVEMFNDRQKLIVAFKLFVLYYKDVLNQLLDIKLEYFNDYMESVSKIALKNTVEDISKKIKIIIDLSVNIKYSLNINLLMDKLDILVSEVSHA